MRETLELRFNVRAHTLLRNTQSAIGQLVFCKNNVQNVQNCSKRSK